MPNLLGHSTQNGGYKLNWSVTQHLWTSCLCACESVTKQHW